jgi:hypothetical protein
MDEYSIRNKIHELRSYIASDWPGIEERKRLYESLYALEEILKKVVHEAENKQEKN